MSKYTTEVRFICEMKSGFDPDTITTKTVDEIITAARPEIFDFTYPIYDSAHKPVLETKILKHYYTREIGAETYSLWKLWLNDSLNLIMPKYNRLYEYENAILQKELANIDVTTVINREDDFTRTDNLRDESDTTRTDNLTETTKDRYSDTPQGTITNVDNDSYLTDYRNVTGTNTGTQRNAGSVDHTGTQRNAGSQDTTETETGYRGSKTYFELLSDYKEKLLNIDQMIVLELSDCFLKLW